MEMKTPTTVTGRTFRDRRTKQKYTRTMQTTECNQQVDKDKDSQNMYGKQSI